MRKANVERKTLETDIKLLFQMDGQGKYEIDTGIGFFDHMLQLMCKHGFFDMDLACKGDLAVDNHHTVEDVGIVLGKAFAEALGDKAGIARYGTAYTPMDESLSMVSVDISGRPYLHYNVSFQNPYAGKFETELVEEFFRAFVNHARITLHIHLICGKNTHHIIESIFKGFGRALDQASAIQGRIHGILSSKGLI
ncbi:imidazoleglycerol-phosphate dehydratase HisB [Thermotalea metallivorans]|uniref:Imidazoleglycerol-phosphate dehydratase n=1 Tax=Thermotalea metallivorans TaxID=520762 RepID=A0A140L9I5_9FIRM|nr:imidazoleglycerol-phosphate dehydratase HisB [Thermotalea metallivorans]KXG77210.1 Imidazoleglycerol-phosphate dehydratase [Thermotalea metallivorans]